MRRMPATPSRSNAFTPPPSSGETGIMPDLYRLSVGPLNAAYYQQQFSRFETLGKAVPSWNHGAAFFTLAWLVLRKLWRPAGIYAGVVLALVLLWAFVLHARVPVAVEAAGCLFTLGLLCVVPGFLANGWYYQQVRSQTLSTLTAASSIAQARAKLGHGAPNKARLYRIAAVQALGSVALAALVYSQWDHASRGAPSSPAPSGPPDLVIPQVSSLYSPAPSAPWMEPCCRRLWQHRCRPPWLTDRLAEALPARRQPLCPKHAPGCPPRTRHTGSTAGRYHHCCRSDFSHRSFSRSQRASPFLQLCLRRLRRRTPHLQQPAKLRPSSRRPLLPDCPRKNPPPNGRYQQNQSSRQSPLLHHLAV